MEKFRFGAKPFFWFWFLFQLSGLDPFKAGLGNVWPAGHIRPSKHLNVARELHLKFLLNSYIDYENKLNIKKVPVLLQSNLKIHGRIPNLSLMWSAKPKELHTPDLKYIK